MVQVDVMLSLMHEISEYWNPGLRNKIEGYITANETLLKFSFFFKENTAIVSLLFC